MATATRPVASDASQTGQQDFAATRPCLIAGLHASWILPPGMFPGDAEGVPIAADMLAPDGAGDPAWMSQTDPGHTSRDAGMRDNALAVRDHDVPLEPTDADLAARDIQDTMLQAPAGASHSDSRSQDWQAPLRPGVPEGRQMPDMGTLGLERHDAAEWHGVTFSPPPAARVAMEPLGSNGADPAVAQIRDGTDAGFGFGIDGRDDPHSVHVRETAIPDPGRQILVSNSTELVAAFADAKGGDAILLAPGSYAGFNLWDQDLDRGDVPVTVSSADPDDPAVITGPVRLHHVEHVDFHDIVFDAAAMAANSWEAWLYVTNSENLSFASMSFAGERGGPDAADPYAPTTGGGSIIAGYPRTVGVHLKDTVGVDITDSLFTDLRVGLRAENSRDLTLTDSDLTALREGVNIIGVTGMTIAGNSFFDFTPWLPFNHPDYDGGRHDHSDMIQFWGQNAIRGVHDITIADNLFSMPEGSSTQTIFGNMWQAPDGVTASNFTVTDNIILNAHPLGISLGDVAGGLIAGNVLLPNGAVDPAWVPQIDLSRTSRDFVVRDNALVGWDYHFLLELTDAELAARNILFYDTTLLSQDPASALYFDSRSPEEWQALLRPGIPEGTPMLDMGTLTLEQHDAAEWHSVTFSNPIPAARVAMGPLSSNGADPAFAHVRNVTDTGFEFRINEWDYLDGAHILETVSWMAVSEGRHHLASGEVINAGRLTLEMTLAGNDARTVELGGFTDRPSVFTQVTSANGGQAVTTRNADVGGTAFSVRLTEEEANYQTHVPETVDWIAIDPGPAASGGVLTGGRANRVDHVPTSPALPVDVDGLVFLADMQTTNGIDPSSLRYATDPAGGLILQVQEERSRDSETAHAAEEIAWITAQSGSHMLIPLSDWA